MQQENNNIYKQKENTTINLLVWTHQRINAQMKCFFLESFSTSPASLFNSSAASDILFLMPEPCAIGASSSTPSVI